MQHLRHNGCCPVIPSDESCRKPLNQFQGLKLVKHLNRKTPLNRIKITIYNLARANNTNITLISKVSTSFIANIQKWCGAGAKYSSHAHFTRLANRPGMAGIVPELHHGVLCPGQCSFCPGNVKIDHRAWIYGCSLMSVLYFVSCVSVTRLDWLECDVTD